MHTLTDELAVLGIAPSDWPDALADSRCLEFEPWMARWVAPRPPGVSECVWRSRALQVYETSPWVYYFGTHVN